MRNLDTQKSVLIAIKKAANPVKTTTSTKTTTTTTTTTKSKPIQIIIDETSELSKPQKQQVRRYCSPAEENEKDLVNFTMINTSMENKSQQDKWLALSTQ